MRLVENALSRRMFWKPAPAFMLLDNVAASAVDDGGMRDGDVMKPPERT